MSFESFEGFVRTMYKEKLEDELFHSWSSNPFQEKDFEVWKAEKLANNLKPTETAEESQEKALDGYKKAMSILDSIGGGAIGD